MVTRLQDLCLQKDISLTSLADHCGIDIKRLQAIYLGRWTPSPIQRENIAHALNTPCDNIAWQHRNSVEHFYGPF